MAKNHEVGEVLPPGWDKLCNRAARDRKRRRLGDSAAMREQEARIRLEQDAIRRVAMQDDDFVSLQVSEPRRRGLGH